jgi:phage/plasmid-like protein (TIGR03299 family)
MSHELDTTTGRAAMAYIEGSAVPWHGLGFTVNPNATPDEWREAAGLNWEAKKGALYFSPEGSETLIRHQRRNALYRSDTQQVLSIVGNKYHPVQPKEIVDFFGTLSKAGDFEIETVGALYEGRRIWALARVGADAPVMDDKVAPYLLLATSYDGTTATTARFTPVRVVCNNTLTAALESTTGGQTISMNHAAKFNPEKMRQDLGIALNAWDRFMISARKMAGVKVNAETADHYLTTLMFSVTPNTMLATEESLRATKGYREIMALFQGGQLGTGQDAIDGTAWGLLNATTQYIDHGRGTKQDTRLESAWFGQGAKFKQYAQTLAAQLA